MAKVLVVDDDPNLIVLLRHILTHAGHEVITAVNGKEGLAAARQEKPDLIILDVMMPEIDGITASGILFQDPGLRQIPVLILTAKPSARGLVELLPNVRKYMLKPFDQGALMQAVKDLLAAVPNRTTTSPQ